FARPVIRRLRGERQAFRKTFEVRVRENVSIAAPLTHFMRVIVDWQDGTAWARLTGPQGSGLLTSMAGANALIVVPPERQTIRAGEMARALPIGDGALSAAQLEL